MRLQKPSKQEGESLRRKIQKRVVKSLIDLNVSIFRTDSQPNRRLPNNNDLLGIHMRWTLTIKLIADMLRVILYTKK